MSRLQSRLTPKAGEPRFAPFNNNTVSKPVRRPELASCVCHSPKQIVLCQVRGSSQPVDWQHSPVRSVGPPVRGVWEAGAGSIQPPSSSSTSTAARTARLAGRTSLSTRYPWRAETLPRRSLRPERAWRLKASSRQTRSWRRRIVIQDWYNNIDIIQDI